VRKRIREYLLKTLLQMQRAEGGAGIPSALPGRIGSLPAPSTHSQAKFLGVLEGLYIAGQLSEQEVTDWSMRSGILSSTFVVVGEGYPGSETEWPQGETLRRWDSIVKYVDIENGRLTLLHVEMHSRGLRLGWRLDLSPTGHSKVDTARSQLTVMPPELQDLQIAKSLLPALDSLVVTNGTVAFRFLDLSVAFQSDQDLDVYVRFSARPDPASSVKVGWAGLTYLASIDSEHGQRA